MLFKFLLYLIIYIYFGSVIISIILFYYYFLKSKMAYYDYNSSNNYNDLNNILLNENMTNGNRWYFCSRFSLNLKILNQKMNNVFNSCIGKIKKLIRTYKYKKININDDIYINDDDLNSDEYYENEELDKPYFNFELSNNDVNSIQNNNQLHSLIQKSRDQNYLNADLTSTIDTTEIYNDSNSKELDFNFSVTRVDSDTSEDSCLNDLII
jgi:hypothetical protein